MTRSGSNTACLAGPGPAFFVATAGSNFKSADRLFQLTGVFSDGSAMLERVFRFIGTLGGQHDHITHPCMDLITHGQLSRGGVSDTAANLVHLANRLSNLL